MREFTVSAFPDITFREMNVSPVDLLAIATQTDFDKFEKSKEIFNFALEHVECCINDKWVPVKVKGRDVYMPIGIEKKFSALNEIIKWYLENVIYEVFRESAELTNEM